MHLDETRMLVNEFGIHILSDHYWSFVLGNFIVLAKSTKNISIRQMKNLDQNEFVNELLGKDRRVIVR